MKKIINKVVAFILTTVLVVGIFLTTSWQVNAYDSNITNGVVYIEEFAYGAVLAYSDGTIYRNLGDTCLWSGSGFFVGKDSAQYIVTNCHVVQNYLDCNKGEAGGAYCFTTTNGEKIYAVWDKMEIRVYYSQDDYDVAYVEDYGSVDEVDLALLKLKSPTDKRTPLTLYDIPKDEDSKNALKGESVIVLGYPSIVDNDFSGGSDQFDENAIRANEGIINNYSITEKGIGWFEHSAETTHGNSGGPLILKENGCVVGVHSAGDQVDSIKQNFAIDVEYVIDMLDDNGVAYSLSSDTVSEDTADLDDAAASDGTDAASPSSEGAGGAGGVVIIIAVVVVAVLGIIVFVVKSKSKSGAKGKSGDDPFKTEVFPEAPRPVAAQTSQAMPVAKSLAAQHNGAVFSLAAGPITVGRDASVCKLIYKDGTPGVSGKHCTIEYRPATNNFVVTDLGSSVGTFLMNGTKMEPNRHYSFNIGDSFYVGDKANVIRLETQGQSSSVGHTVAAVSSQPTSAPARTPMVRSLAAQHNGASFALSNGPITVGRDASACKIVYQSGTPGISGKHCTIEYRPSQNVFIVTDLNSSYGSFLANGTKMEPNRHYSFNPGDSFFVGDKANELRFEVH